MRTLFILGLLLVVSCECNCCEEEQEKPPDSMIREQPATREQPTNRAGTDVDIDSGAADPERKKLLDEADLVVLRAAKKMLEAERQLQQEIAAGRITGVERYLTFEELSDWNYVLALKGMPAEIKKLDGQKFMMAGFMLPVEELKNMKEFILVQSLWACCVGQPPDIHQMVRVVLPEKLRIDHSYAPHKIVGRLKVSAHMDDDYCLDIYQFHAESIEPIELKK